MTSSPSPAKACFLMCPPQHFAVTYAINPWMDPGDWARNAPTFSAQSRVEWDRLRGSLRDLSAEIELLRPHGEMPDLVFTANAAVVLDRKALLSRFRHPQRQTEQPHVEEAFCALRARGLIDAVTTLPDGLVLEGAGDCVWDRTRQLFWMGFGQRSDAAASQVIDEVFGVEVVPLELADPRFYHMDTALCALPRGEVMYVPQALTPAAQGALWSRVAPDQRIEVDIEEASGLAANAVCLDDTLLMSSCGDRLRARLHERGYRVAVIPLGSFLRSGGAAFCLTLRLDWRSQRTVTAADAGVAA
jgi:N-dimethylarginine dimethylaminohydrolase